MAIREIHEIQDRRFVAEHETRSHQERRQIERETRKDPGSVYSRVEVTVSDGTPPATAAELLRAIAADLEAQP